MIYATKKKGESNERLINRFKQVVQRSRIIFRSKKERFRVAKPKKRSVRAAAVMRSKHRTKRAKEQFYS
ncbi:hypothetical protein ACFL6I_05720 [candidate division KSB1 bacterium]